MNIICIYVGTEKARFADIIMPCGDYDDDDDDDDDGVEVISAGSSVHQMIRAGSRPRSEYNLHLCAGRCRN